MLREGLVFLQSLVAMWEGILRQRQDGQVRTRGWGLGVAVGREGIRMPQDPEAEVVSWACTGGLRSPPPPTWCRCEQTRAAGFGRLVCTRAAGLGAKALRLGVHALIGLLW